MLNGGNDEACLARSRLTGLRVTPFMTLSYRRQASALSSLAPNSNSGVLASIILKLKKPLNKLAAFFNSGTTRLELATSCVTGMRSNQTELRSHISGICQEFFLRGAPHPLSLSFDKFYYNMLNFFLQEYFLIFFNILAIFIFTYFYQLMQVSFSNNYNNCSFCANPFPVYRAKEVCECVKEAFPYISPTRVSSKYRNQLLMHERILNSIRELQKKIEVTRNMREAVLDKPVEYYRALVNDTKSIRALNCGEYASLSYLSLKMNGVENCRLANVITGNGRNVDHTVVLVGGGTENIVLDAWLGVVETERNMNALYNTKFANFFELVPNEKVKFVPVKAVDIDENSLNQIKSFVPELYVNRNMNVMA